MQYPLTLSLNVVLILGQLGVLGPIVGCCVNPRYTVEADDPAPPEREGAPVMTPEKPPARFEGPFALSRTGGPMMALRERMRG